MNRVPWQAVTLFTAAFLALCGFWLGMFWLAEATGFNLQSTPEYGFSSGIGPMILTALLGAGVLTTFWHSRNCHYEGCWSIGKHRLNGSPWCGAHKEYGEHEVSDHHLLEQILMALNSTNALLREIRGQQE